MMRIMAAMLLLCVLTSGCATTSQLMHTSMSITAGQTPDDVTQLLGPPKNRQWNGAEEAWQYCHTDIWGLSGDDYVVVWFVDHKVTGVTTYKNTNFGNCEMFFPRWPPQLPPPVAGSNSSTRLAAERLDFRSGWSS